MRSVIRQSARLAFVAALMGPIAAPAAVIQWDAASGGNDHFYDFVPTLVNRIVASNSALASSLDGQPGYLATITSAAENEFIRTMVSNSRGWLAGTDIDFEGVWKWDQGPESGTTFWDRGTTTTYANWQAGEPSNSRGGDFFGEYYLTMNQFGPGNGTWNDVPFSTTSGAPVRFGYFVEYRSGSTAVPAVPEPATWAMMIVGFCAVGYSLRRRRGQVRLPQAI